MIACSPQNFKFKYPSDITRSEGDKGYRDVVRYPEVNDDFLSDSRQHLGSQPALMPSGYSKAPADDPNYENNLKSFLSSVIDDKVAVVTSSTTGSVEKVATIEALADGAPVIHVTAERYMNKYTPAVSDFSAADQEQAASVPKLILPDKETYLEGAVKASDALLLMGGRGAAVGDFKNSVELGHPTVIAVDLDAPQFAWDDYKETKVPNNASLYLADQIGQSQIQEPDNFPQAISDEWINENREKLDTQVKVVNFHSSNPDEIQAAANEAQKFLLAR